ncbi:MAG: hypothetical protein CEO19_287 [Parcubacteria group bacterium Gr01-1014_73]|nr:MAG: hypothetical protein CEO19_287 [Parcubacteria group bacterium Gr01-1014_73]
MQITHCKILDGYGLVFPALEFKSFQIINRSGDVTVIETKKSKLWLSSSIVEVPDEIFKAAEKFLVAKKELEKIVGPFLF